MELTLSQALQKGIDAHKAGQVQEADRLYTAVLKAQPKHPNANHNMGVLAVSVGKVQEALPFFKEAFEASPSTAQFYLSYINTLIKLERLADAKAVLHNAKVKGATGEGFNKLEQQLEGVELTANIAPNNQDPTQDQLSSLIDLYSKGQTQQSLEQVNTLLKQFPNAVVLYNILGAVHADLNQLDAAIEAYKKALSLKHDYADAYYNMGKVLQKQGKLEMAIEAYNKALSIRPCYAAACINLGACFQSLAQFGKAVNAYKDALSIRPDYAVAHYNMGNVLQDQGKLNEAIEAYNEALSIQPDYTKAYYNLGNVLREQGRLCDATEAYKKALNINPEFIDAYNNMGVTFQERGKLKDAIKAHKKAISIKPDYVEAWNNIVFPIQAMKAKISYPEELDFYLPEDTASKYSKIAKSILHYRLNRGGDNAESSLNLSLSLLSNAKNSIIKNPEDSKISKGLNPALPGKVIALVHFGRSGTGLLHSLVDGHPEVSTLPSIYFSEYFDYSTWENIIGDGWSEITDRFIAIYAVLFDASSNVPIETKGKKLLHNIGQKDGMASVGDKQDEVLRVDTAIFRSELNRLMTYYDVLDAFVFFKLVHVAYEKSIKSLNQKNLVFYHIHNPDTYAELNFVRLAPTANWLILVREPIQSCESWIKSKFIKNDYFSITTDIITMLFEVDNIVYNKNKSIGVRLEDLKERPQKTIPALCKWMGIQEETSLYEMTAQGKKWWGDQSSPDFAKDGMEPFGHKSIKRKVGSIFSEYDQFILQTLFYPFSIRFGYANENIEQFKANLQAIRPMLDEMFDFEKKIVERTGADHQDFMKSGPYLYLKSRLIDRWNTLNKFNTYPNMIEPLTID